MNSLKYILTSIILIYFCCGCKSSMDHKDDEHDEIHHTHEGAFDMDQSQIERFGVKFEIVKPQSFADVIRVSGVIQPSSSDIITIAAPKSGTFTLSPDLSQGTQVRAKEAIGFISPENVQGGDAAAAAKANLDAAKKEYERLKPLYKDGLITASTFNEAERVYNEAKAFSSVAVLPGKVTITAPSSGILASLLVSSGQFVESGSPIAMISKNSRLTLRADIPSRYASLIPAIISANIKPENSDTIISLSALEGKKISGSENSGIVNGYIPVYFSFNGNPMTLPGGFTDVFLIGNQRENVLTLPKDALLEMQGNFYAYVVKDGHAFEKRLVKTGATDGNRVEIIEGINSGEQIVSRGAAVVRMAETSLITPPSHTHNH